MTLILAVWAGPAKGVVCTDRQLTVEDEEEREELGYQSKERKAFYLDNRYFMGFAGTSGLAEEIGSRVSEAVDGRNLGFRQIVRKVTRIYRSMRQDVVRSYVEGRINVKWGDYESGRLSQELKERLEQLLIAEYNRPRVFDVDLLLCGLGEGSIAKPLDFRIYTYEAPGVRQWSKNFDSIGIGSRTAERSLREDFEDIHPHRTDIGIPECARLAMKAKIEAERVYGVGKRGQLVWITQDGLQETSPRETDILRFVLKFNRRYSNILSDADMQRFYKEILGTQNKTDRTSATDEIVKYILRKIPPKLLFKYARTQ